MSSETKMTFLEHFGILRKSFIKIIVFIAILFVPAFLFREILMELALVPITESIPNDSKIIFTKPAEALSSNIRLALLTSFLCSFPLIIYEVWAFIGPGLYQKEKRISLMVIILGTALFFLGAFLCFKFVAPLTFNILLNEYSSESIIAFPNISDTLSFLSSLILSFGIIFEYPLIIFLLSKIGVVSSKFLSSKRKYAILISTIISAILTPTTDVFSMLFMLVPLVLFYEIGILISLVTYKKR
ncbi:twin-arginine translocase subunit TatC [bacterium]|nr:twin-arginine translocase subunit TatC [bacterium]MBT3850259.1 twin-arginine translocase subunit TatC [bacterium]MDG2445999.1 twin-arginine translocase subunit TatC [Thermodesulfobacteriota bacterium]